MAIFLGDEFDVEAMKSSTSRAFASKGWSNNTARKRLESITLICVMHTFTSSDLRSYRLVYVDESGCDERIGFRRTGWPPHGTAPVQMFKFYRDQTYTACICPRPHCSFLCLQGSTATSIFEDFIEELLQHCVRWPESKSCHSDGQRVFSSFWAGSANMFRNRSEDGAFAPY